jgi:RimJ/RimL family protein N-acetyltransferase
VFWPFFDLRIASGEVLLRGVTDADLPFLLRELPDDLEMNPANRTLPALDRRTDRRRQVAAEIWKHRGTWSIDSWCLDLAVEVDGHVVGVQAVEGEQFLQLRTVDSYSWLSADARGRGLAHLMRAGVLALAFGHLGAEYAVSSAVLDNARRWRSPADWATSTTVSAASPRRRARPPCSTCASLGRPGCGPTAPPRSRVWRPACRGSGSARRPAEDPRSPAPA